MSLSTLGSLGPAVAAAVIAAMIPRQAKTKHRIGLGAVAFMLVGAIA